MKVVFLVLLGVLAASLVIIAIEPITRRCLERLRAWEAASGGVGGRLAAAGQRAGAPTTPLPPIPSVPAEEKTGYHVSQLLVRDGVLGLFFSLIVIVFAVLNSRILAECFEILLNRSGAVVGVLHLTGLQLEVTDFHLYGVCLSLALILIGAAFASAYEKGSRWQWAALLGALVPLVLFETALAGLRGEVLAREGDAHPLITPHVLAAYSALQAYVCAVTEACAGYFAVHCALVPLVQAVAWLVITPFRLVARGLAWLGRRQPRPRAVANPLRPKWPTRFGAYVDEAICEPLRHVDRRAGAAWRESA